ncbi:MAG: alanine racemase [Actinomycetota bacterium]|nr:alanine racemase [Actinomycetota bacterium]
MEGKIRPAYAEIDLGAIRNNVSSLKSRLGPNVKFMAVVKADAYGHGDIEVSMAALEGGADRLGVALIEEAVKLKRASIAAPIHILSDIPPYAAEEAVENDLVLTVSLIGAARAIWAAAEKLGKRAKVHVKLDTGMNRIGVDPARAKGFIEELSALSALEIEGIFTHFATAGEDDAFMGEQLKKFEDLIRELEVAGITIPIKHAANSAATILEPKSHLDMVRCGISVYGLHPAESTKGVIDLNPALSLKAMISSVKTIEAGEGVSYGLTFKAKKRSNIATIPLGYADGYSRNLSNLGSVLIDGERFSVAGNVCMDQFMVDIEERDFKVGDEVVLIGASGPERISADEIASLLSTINYEIVCMISGRIPRVYIDG